VARSAVMERQNDRCQPSILAICLSTELIAEFQINEL
jgi:hypothetical protein